MVLVDTSIWIAHFKSEQEDLVALLEEGAVLTHPMIIGEISCGAMKHRKEIIQLMLRLPQAEILAMTEALSFIEDHQCYGKGIGWVDVHLLASAMLCSATLWSRDKSLMKLAKQLGLG